MELNEARIILLKDALRQAVSTATFLHNCLIKPAEHNLGGYTYLYPKQTTDAISDWEALIEDKDLHKCHHSKREADCKYCDWKNRLAATLQEAKTIITNAKSTS